MGKTDVFQSVDTNADMLKDIARKIWERPELSLEESYASGLQASALEQAGLRVTRGLKDLPTALVAEYGEGKPVIGILGEYDALAGLSQDTTPQRKPLKDGEPGHGCGHNLLGTAGVGAAIAIKGAIDRGEIKGTVRYYGCPAEEELIGKIFMLRDGYFDDCDALLYWHPGSNNYPWRGSSLANTSVVFSFKGLSAHAPQAHLGRSALDAVELMNVGANYLREHLPGTVMMHYSTLGNGIAPNVVPDKCQVWYMMRSPQRAELEQAFARLVDVANGAALMTGTEFAGYEVLGGAYEMNCNKTIADTFYKNMEQLGGPTYTDEDMKMAADMNEYFDAGQKQAGSKAFFVPEQDIDMLIETNIYPNADGGGLLRASLDADVSWLKPFGSFSAATFPIGVFTHTWQATACTGSGIGLAGMLFASKVLAGAIYDFMGDPALMQQVQADFERSVKEKGVDYKMPLAPESKPHRVQ